MTNPTTGQRGPDEVAAEPCSASALSADVGSEGAPDAGPDVASRADPGADQLGARLDEHHGPETNGRIPVCRRCGTPTDAAHGRHAPTDREVERGLRWIDAQSRRDRIELARRRGNT